MIDTIVLVNFAPVLHFLYLNVPLAFETSESRAMQSPAHIRAIFVVHFAAFLDTALHSGIMPVASCAET